MTEPQEWFTRIYGTLSKNGLILESDPVLPSVAGVIAGERIRGSWWGHPKNRLIFRVLGQLAASPEVLTTKLVSGKTTFVHRTLWPEFLTLATSGEPWQTTGLSTVAKPLFDQVSSSGELSAIDYANATGLTVGMVGEAARDLERRMLVHGWEFHTESGMHAKRLQTWEKWTSDKKYAWKPASSEIAKRKFETLIQPLSSSETHGKRPTLPWHIPV